jgi:protein SCO1
MLAIVFASCLQKNKPAALPYYNTPDFTPQFLALNDVDGKITHTISPFSFTDQHGKEINDKDVKGKIHVANFIFTSCGSICPTMTKHMKLLQQEFQSNPDVVMLSYSVTPWIDSVVRLKKYADNNGIVSSNWHLLTGNKGDIYTLARQSYFAEEDLGFTKDSTEFLHTEHILLVDKTSHIRGIYNGTLQLEAEQLVKDINVLLKE